MTHSHATSTPAMSAETVPSEEFVLVPREPTERMLKAADGWTDLIDAAGENTAESRRSEFRIAWKSMVEAAPNLSASHLAKEGEDDEETTLENRIDNAVQAMSETHHSWEARCHAIMAALGFNFGWKTPRVDEEPSPALAKGGDAVRVPPIEQTTTNDQIAAVMLQTGSPAQVRQALAYAAGNLGASTPTEGPTSQTEGMGGDALRERIARALNGVLGSEEDEHPRHHPAQNSWEKPSEVWWTQWLEAADAVIAALTPPETAEAVPVASDPAPATDDRERLVEALRAADSGLAAMIRLSEMGLEESLREPEESGNFASFEQAKRCLATVRAALATEAGK